MIKFLSMVVPVHQTVTMGPLRCSNGSVASSHRVSPVGAILTLLLLLPVPLLSISFSLTREAGSVLVTLIKLPYFINTIMLNVRPIVTLARGLYLEPLNTVLKLSRHVLREQLDESPTHTIKAVVALSLKLNKFVTVRV